jgi:hypothetical protein
MDQFTKGLELGMKMRILAVLLVLACGLNLGAISPAELQAHVSFLASDALEGRDTPSRGLDIAAEYIAAQMRRGGLKPAGTEGFFQTARMRQWQASKEGFMLRGEAAGKSFQVDAAKVRLSVGPAVNLTDAEFFRGVLGDTGVDLGQRQEPVLVLDVPGNMLPQALGGYVEALRKSKWAGKALILLGAVPVPGTSMRAPVEPGFLLMAVGEDEFMKWARALPVGKVDGKMSLNTSAPNSREIVARNVVGLLEGSDDKLKDTYVMLTAHYDHLGVREGEGDRVFNGANDNASGVAGMLESAWWLHEAKPKRSVLFIAFFGEERGLWGSRYYAEHPLRPLAKTVANVNLEQLGRTDSSDGANVGMLNLTGYHFSSIHKYFEAAGEKTKLKIVKHERFSDPFFMASDNAALAQVGVPATTVSVTYQFPDYHQKGDEWDKLDYKNMALVTTTVAEAVKGMADSDVAVAWDASNSKVKAYVEAAKKVVSTQP